MFGLGSSSKQKLAKKIVNQIVGFQSVMFRLSHERLGINESDINRLEITYYGMSLVTLSVLCVSKHKNKLAAVEQAQLDALKTSLPSSGSKLGFETAISQYQERFMQYKEVFGQIVDGDRLDPEVDLAALYVHYVSQGKSTLPDYLSAYSIFAQGVTDNLDFAKNVL